MVLRRVGMLALKRRLAQKLNGAENTVKDMLTKPDAVLLWLFGKDYEAHIHSES